MTRAVSLVLLVFACKSGSEARDPDQPAGKVVEVAGRVTAARPGAEVRRLERGQVVFSDDTVTTAADASAVILLAHNNVHWSLGASKSVRVDGSLAWKAKADEGGSAFDDSEEVATASAGRHTEREAGDTASTAPAPADQAEGGAPEPAVVARAEQKSGGAVAQRHKSVKGGEVARGAAEKLLVEPSGGGAASRNFGAAAVVTPPMAAASAESAPAASPVAPAISLGKLTVEGGRSESEVAARFAGFGARCKGAVAGSLTLRFDIDATGKVIKIGLTGDSKVAASVKSCLTAAAAAIRFPAGGTAHVEREIRIQVR
jgi:hypothetical protein